VRFVHRAHIELTGHSGSVGASRGKKITVANHHRRSHQ
jgi:hypothetical protein